jgi:hypothetical protein
MRLVSTSCVQKWEVASTHGSGLGMYTVMVVMTLHFLFQRGKPWVNNRLAFSYTIGMAVLTTVWYYTNARVTEVSAIESLVPQFSSQLAIAEGCGATNMLGTSLSLVMMISNDVLMVSKYLIMISTHARCNKTYSFTVRGSSSKSTSSSWPSLLPW